MPAAWKNTRSATFACGVIAVLAVGCRVPAYAGAAAPVSADCDMIELPDERGDTYVKFTLSNAGPVDASAVTMRLYDQGWEPGEEIGTDSVITLKGRIPAKGAITRWDTVKGPPDYHNGKFDSLGCTIVSVRFSDGTAWQ